MDRILAEESVRLFEIIAMGSGNTKEETAEKKLDEWQSSMSDGENPESYVGAGMFDRDNRPERLPIEEVAKSLTARGWRRIGATPRE